MAFEISSPSQQVAAHLRDLIHKGRWRKAMPGTPAIAEELDIDRKTVTAAIRQLEEEGLVKSQGPGKPRTVARRKKPDTTRLHIRFLVYEDDDRQRNHVMELLPRIRELGHHFEIDRRTLTSLGMNLERIKSHVRQNPADVWLVQSAPEEVLEWFASQQTPAMAVFGRRRRIKIASIGPDKVAAMRTCVDRLVELGHRRIVLLAREERRHPKPGHLESEFLRRLEFHGIPAGPYHLPEWKDDPVSFHQCLETLFSHTPPTALIFDEAQFYVAGLQHLAQMKLSPPHDISLVSCDNHAIFEWCRPSVSHMAWDAEKVVNHIVHWVRQLSHGVHDDKTCYIPAEFRENGSIGPAPISG